MLGGTFKGVTLKVSLKLDFIRKPLKTMAGVAGLEPVTSAVTGQRSNQLSYTPAKGKVRLKNVFQGVKLENICPDFLSHV
jgi:hypothetical protein